MLIGFLIALVSGVLFFLQSGGTKYFGLPKIKDVWTILGSATVVVGPYLLNAANYGWLEAAFVFLLWGGVMTMARGPAFRGPNQTVSLEDKDDDYILKYLCKWLGKKDGDSMGIPLWGTYQCLRWVLPISLIAISLGSYGYLAGLFVPIGYVAIAALICKHTSLLAYEGSDGREHVGAFFAGFLPVFFLLGTV